jgi:hypothetical protein
VARRSQEKSEKLKAVEGGFRELQAKDRCIEEEIRKNIDLRKDLDKLKQERTRETWLLKNNIRNLEVQLRAPRTVRGAEKSASRQVLSSLEYFL